MTLHEAIALAQAAGTIVTDDRLAVLYELAGSAPVGEFWECGVYQGGTAKMLAQFGRTLRLFDTFTGMPPVDEVDWHRPGDFADTSLEGVSAKLKDSPGDIRIYPGWFPATFPIDHGPIAFAHVDADIYSSVKACATSIWPHLVLGGAILFDDYGFPTCPGAKLAADEFVTANGLKLDLPGTGQAILRKLCV